MADLVGKDMEYADVSEAVRHYSAEQLYALIERLKPTADNLYDSDLGFMDPVRISAHTQVGKLYLAALRELGQLYRVSHEPVVPEPEVPMVPADQVPLMIEAAVTSAVELAVQETEARILAVKEERARVTAQEAKAAVGQALQRIRERSSR